jgi:CRISPR-associated protein Cmr4
MSIWQDISICGIYSIGPTHCGIGQAAGAVDLPIARDASTGFPILPATSLKGVARDFLSRNNLKSNEINYLFGKELDLVSPESLEAGALAFTEARLIAFPVRSCNQPFMHVTCPLILERLQRDLRALGITGFLPSDWQASRPEPGQAHVAAKNLSGTTVVLEDLVFPGNAVGCPGWVSALAKSLSELLPRGEAETRDRIHSSLAVIPDADFSDLIQRAIPVRARIKLTDGKTTDTWRDPKTGETQKGNLWYEEYLPSDVLFISFIGERRQRQAFHDAAEEKTENGSLSALGLFRKHQESFQVMQIGGNETVGHGICYWTLWPQEGRK